MKKICKRNLIKKNNDETPLFYIQQGHANLLSGLLGCPILQSFFKKWF